MLDNKSIVFVKACIDSGIKTLDTSAHKEKAKLIAKQKGINDYEDIDSLQQMIDDYLTMEQKDKEERKKERIRALKASELYTKSKIEKYADLVGREKSIKYYEDEISTCDATIAIRDDAIKSGKEIKTVYNALNASLEPIKPSPEQDWAIAGGIASALGGPAAGLAVASDIQRKNAESRIDYEEARKSVDRERTNNTNVANHLANKILDNCIVSSEEYISAKRLRRKYIRLKEQCELLLVDNDIDSYQLMNALAPSVVSLQITESGSVHISVNVKGDVYKIYEDVPAAIDGSIKAILWNEEDECCGVASLVLPVNGVNENTTLEAWFTETQNDNATYTIEFTKPNLWLIEALNVSDTKLPAKAVPVEECYNKNAEKYYEAYVLMKSMDVSAVKNAHTVFESLDNWKDAKKQKQRCFEIIQQLEEKERLEAELREKELQAEKQRQIAIEQERIQNAEKEREKKAKIKRTVITGFAIAFVCILLFAIVTEVIIPNKEKAGRYAEAVELYSEEKYDKAIPELLALEDYKDSEEVLYNCISKVAEKAMTGDSKSLSILSNIPYSYYKEHIEASYSYALVLAAIPDWASAEKYFRMCGDYESAEEYATYCKAKTLIDLSDYGNAMAQIKTIPGFLDSDDILKDLYYQKVASAEKMNLDKAIEILGSASELNQKGQALYDVCCQLQNCTGKYNCYKTKNADGSYGKPSTCQLTFEFYLQEGRPYLRVDNSFFADTKIYDAPVEKGSGDYPYVARCPTSSRDGKIVVHWFSEDEAMTTNASKTGKMYIYRKLGQ